MEEKKKKKKKADQKENKNRQSIITMKHCTFSFVDQTHSQAVDIDISSVDQTHSQAVDIDISSVDQTHSQGLAFAYRNRTYIIREREISDFDWSKFQSDWRNG